jgi:hypothetical protein
MISSLAMDKDAIEAEKDNANFDVNAEKRHQHIYFSTSSGKDQRKIAACIETNALSSVRWRVRRR